MKPIIILILTSCMVLNTITMTYQKAYGATGTAPFSVTVNGSLVLTDASNDTMSGKDPTINVALSVTPDLGATTVSDTANFRIRSNQNVWRLTAQKTSSNTGGTGLTDSDITLNISKSAGSKANTNAGTLVSPFNNATTIGSIPSSSTANVVSGTAKTSSGRDSANTDNYFQVNTTYSVVPDFFYTPGTFSTTITYNLVSP